MVKISVIVPCYKQAQYLDECLQSVYDQTYQDWECIIVNDGSPDDTEKVAKKWLEKDGRFKYYYKHNGGLSSARNFGIKNAQGEWILPLDADDYISHDYLTIGQTHFDNEEVKVIYCNAKKFGLNNEKLELKEFSLKQLAIENLIFCSAFFRKRDWENVNGYDENLRLGYEDWEFWINILKNGGGVLRLNEFCFFYRVKENSMLNTLKENNGHSTIKYIEKKHLAFFHQHLGTLHGLFQKNMHHKKALEVISGRFFSKVINKLYSLKENWTKSNCK